MDTSDEDLLDSHEDEIVVLNTLETSPATFSTQLIRKLGLKAKRTLRQRLPFQIQHNYIIGVCHTLNCNWFLPFIL